MLNLHAYLSEAADEPLDGRGRAAAVLRSDPAALPARGPIHFARGGRRAGRDDHRFPRARGTLPPPSGTPTWPASTKPGWLHNTDRTRRYAVNVDPAEGDLAIVGAEQLASRLEGVKYQYAQAATFQTAAAESAGYNLTEPILYGLVLLLIGEQLLAWSASYHAKGGRYIRAGQRRRRMTVLALLSSGADRSRTTFEWASIRSNGDWIAPIAVLLLVLVFVWYMYRRDSVELRRPWRWLLTALRLATFVGLLAIYLQPHWRTEREQVRNSRAVILVDTSLSMGLTDADGPGESRWRQVAKALADSDFSRGCARSTTWRSTSSMKT